MADPQGDAAVPRAEAHLPTASLRPCALRMGPPAPTLQTATLGVGPGGTPQRPSGYVWTGRKGVSE